MEKENLKFILQPMFEQLNTIVKDFNFDVPMLQTEHDLKALYYELQFNYKDIWYQVQQLSISVSKKKLFFLVVALINEDIYKTKNYEYVFLSRYVFNPQKYKEEACTKVCFGGLSNPVKEFLMDVILEREEIN